MVLLYAILGMAQAEDILIPHISPVQLEDMSIAMEMENELVGALQDLGISVIAPSVLDQEFPELSSNCFDIDDCSTKLFERDHSSIALIGSLETTSSGYNIQMRFYARTSRSPLDIQSFSISQGELDGTIRRIAEDASVMFSLLPEEETVIEPTIVEKETESQVVIIEKFKEKEFVQPPPNRAILSLPSKFEADYTASQLMPEEWLRQRRVRTGNVLIELHAGLALGDVDRSYDTRIGYRSDGESVFDIYEYDTFSPGTGSMLGGGIGFAPLWWLEIGLYGGIILAQKDLSTGWEVQKDDGTITQSDQTDMDPVLAVSGHIEPRLRLYAVPTGPVKPYALLGAYFRLYDPYVVPDLKTVDYANQPGGMHYGVTTGGGLAFDSAGPVGVFFEVPWTYVINQTPYEKSTRLTDAYTEGDLLISDDNIPIRPNYSKQIVGIKVGMNLRFR